MITSYGADKKPGGAGFDEDLQIIIRKRDYMAPVGGHLRPSDAGTAVAINYPENGNLTSKTIGSVGNDNFMSTTENDLIPIGLRSITATIDREEKVFVFSVQPTMNWLGTLR